MKKIFAYTHTHWDREWYQPFETFRVHLVNVLRQILDDLEAAKLSCFYLDGQAVILEDALTLAPELAPRVAALMQKGELSAGPWYVLPDEMLVCGESLLRNLKQGISYVRGFGEPALVGYSPDTFGHSQDLPRILRGFGISSAILWRGVPNLSFGPAFWWLSPDGSKVLAYHLSRGYYQTSLIEKSLDGFANGGMDKLVDELVDFSEDRRQWDNSSLYEKTPDTLLYPIGADHTAPPRNLNEIILELNKKLKPKGLELKNGHLKDFVDVLEKQADASNILVGLIARELRDNSVSSAYGNAYLLPGVLSTRLYLKRENREAERRLFRFVEPLFSLLSMRKLGQYPWAELNYAQKLLLKNHPHDSICGCSVDAVHDEMLTRFARIHQVVDPLIAEAKNKLSGLPDSSSKSAEDPDCGLMRLRVLNPSAGKFTGAIPFEWFELPDRALEHSNELVQIVESTLVDQLFAGFGKPPYYRLVNRKRGFILLRDVPAFGESNLRWPLASESPLPRSEISRVRGKTLDNGVLKVSVDEQSQLHVSFNSADGKQKQYTLKHLIRDTADGGDTYNYDPLPGDKPIQAKLVSLQPGLKGPLVSSLILKHEIKIPAHLIEEKPSLNGSVAPLLKRSSEKLLHEIETEIILKSGSSILEFESRFENKASGHRLELLLSTGHPVHSSFSENHFSLVKRYHQTKSAQKTTLPVEPGCEAPCDRFPTQRFVISNGQLFLNKGLPEYGAEGDSIVMTLLRSVPILSRGRMQARGGGAGPHLPVPGAECKGPNRVSYAWAPLPVFEKKKILSDELEEQILVKAYELAEQYEQELLCTFSMEDDSSTRSLLWTENPAVRVVSSYVSNDGESLYVRLQNLLSEITGTRVFVDFDFQAAHLCRFDEEVGEEVFLYREYVKAERASAVASDAALESCALEINFGASELKTVRFRLKASSVEKATPAARTRKKRSAGSKTG